MVGWVENLIGGAALHDLTQVHDDDAIGEIAHHTQVVADKQQGRLVLALNVGQKLGDGRRHRHIEGGHRLIGDDHGGIAGERTGDADALLLATGKLTWTTDVEIPR